MDKPSGLQEIVSFLEKPASYAHRPESVRLIQTHISYVAIAPPFVYKLKKPVSLGFLDFSSLERRHHFCLEEVRLNRRLCPHTYEGVLAISRTEKGLKFGEEGEIVDYVVKMKYLEEGYFLHERLKTNDVSIENIDRIVDILAAFYAAQEPSKAVTRWGRIDKIRLSTDENFEQVRSFENEVFPASAFRAIRIYTNRFYDTHRALFERRVEQSRILDCHGDLHLEHIHLTSERVCIYDCIEFNERLRYIDVANDVAFLAMDLEHKGFDSLSRYFCEAIAAKLSDSDMPALMSFYKCYRAFVRGKVAAMKSTEEEVGDEGRRLARLEAVSYFQLALGYAIQHRGPVVVVVMGRAGSGKSTQARILAESTGWPLYSSDVMRKRHAGVPLYERGSAAERKSLYSNEMTAWTYDALMAEAKTQVEKGNSVIVEATFSRKSQRERWRAEFTATRTPFVFIEITASSDTMKSRLAQRDSKAGEVSDARLEDFEMLDRQFEASEATEAREICTVSSEHSLDETGYGVLKCLMDRQNG